MVGSIGVALAIGLVVLPIVFGRSEHWPAWGWVVLGASLPVAIATLVYEKRLAARGGQPMLDLTELVATGAARGAEHVPDVGGQLPRANHGGGVDFRMTR